MSAIRMAVWRQTSPAHRAILMEHQVSSLANLTSMSSSRWNLYPDFRWWGDPSLILLPIFKFVISESSREREVCNAGFHFQWCPYSFQMMQSSEAPVEQGRVSPSFRDHGLGGSRFSQWRNAQPVTNSWGHQDSMVDNHYRSARDDYFSCLLDGTYLFFLRATPHTLCCGRSYCFFLIFSLRPRLFRQPQGLKMSTLFKAKGGRHHHPSMCLGI